VHDERAEVDEDAENEEENVPVDDEMTQHFFGSGVTSSGIDSRPTV
jgi:hypothetical protein